MHQNIFVIKQMTVHIHSEATVGLVDKESQTSILGVTLNNSIMKKIFDNFPQLLQIWGGGRGTGTGMVVSALGCYQSG
jgi:hypothetical protein